MGIRVKMTTVDKEIEWSDDVMEFVSEFKERVEEEISLIILMRRENTL